MTVSRTRTQEMPGERDTFVCDCFMKKQEIETEEAKF